MSDALPWISFAVSVFSVSIAGSAWWVSREKLRLDLYNRRFDIYLRTLDFWHALGDWKPTDQEKKFTTLQDSPELRNCADSLHQGKPGSAVPFRRCVGNP